MANNFSLCSGSYVLNQFPSIVMFDMKGFHLSASGAIQGHHGPLVLLPVSVKALAGGGGSKSHSVKVLVFKVKKTAKFDVCGMRRISVA